ncbi:MAG: S-methyl-5'-thioinosine phosphorylase [Desulfitobacteriaceae bacterium]|nr:S-methyl-5'-thioinosine phosphorylase [Desulfitobacteriaceae bacterium]MDD4345957.1 S-methyl-5'-thioinosine phosphorylase [Desulfitobacteriaceae bacterium]MDD4401393.1 S-methyl-5'-thioinosine phosphorylase [Desulfitobacteriaceae bacterium]
MSDFALIGGSGIELIPLSDRKIIAFGTPYGPVQTEKGKLGEKEIVFVNRHGTEHAIPPHLVNYRANLWALRELGVKKILATATMGALSAKYHLNDLVLIDQFLDFTKSRPQTFYEGGVQDVLHVDMTDPYCRQLRQIVVEAGTALNLAVKNGGTYVCTEGPRFETPAEIKMFQVLGGELVGMTSVPEVILAKELGICYATLGIVTNEAAGIANHQLTHAEVMKSIRLIKKSVFALIEKTMRMLTPEQNCTCVLASAEKGRF